MYTMMMERECRGKYYVSGHFEEFERGTFLGFGIDYEEFESGPAQYTTAIVELRDGRVITTTPGDIQFIHCRQTNVQSAPPTPVGAVDVPNDKIQRLREKQEPQEPKKKKTRKKIDYGKIMALRKAGWSNEKIADEMHMTKASVATAISTYKKKCSGGDCPKTQNPNLKVGDRTNDMKPSGSKVDSKSNCNVNLKQKVEINDQTEIVFGQSGGGG